MTNMNAAPSSKLLHLPNELLHEVAFRLATTELRILSQSNHQLHAFVIDYLARYQHNTSICRLPNSVLCNILAQLDEKADRRRLAQVSQKLYSTVMAFIIRHDIQYDKSSMLNHAALEGLEHITRKIIRLGGNVDTTRGSTMRLRLDIDDPDSDKLFTPLMNAAACQSGNVIRSLLGAGEGQVAGGIKDALLVAMLGNRQGSISILAPKISAEDMRDVLASTRGIYFPNSYRWLLENVPYNKHSRYIRSAALYDVLSQGACEEDFVERKLKEDFVKWKLDEEDYQRASFLLAYGADPDFCMLSHENPAMQQVSTRDFASWHSDPRIRNLLLTAELTVRTPDRMHLSTEQLNALMEEDEETEPELPPHQHPNYNFCAKKPTRIIYARR